VNALARGQRRRVRWTSWDEMFKTRRRGASARRKCIPAALWFGGSSDNGAKQVLAVRSFLPFFEKRRHRGETLRCIGCRAVKSACARFAQRRFDVARNGRWRFVAFAGQFREVRERVRGAPATHEAPNQDERRNGAPYRGGKPCAWGCRHARPESEMPHAHDPEATRYKPLRQLLTTARPDRASAVRIPGFMS
jgi:hypothetical protein